MNSRPSKVPVPVDISRLPAYLRPVKPNVTRRSVGEEKEPRDDSHSPWCDYIAMYEGKEL